ncbi:unnamed protein product [Eruca vesicaria subsp. sativa]|uniref:Uncharacterized protein n=1 Tax=Eruca vesicaria subsp. sativa TaxID=29727 RepID=A0ABC8ISU6_ERUVS|nr:unnamed protein product [Eruca vesicaria subsp. sativa]
MEMRFLFPKRNQNRKRSKWYETFTKSRFQNCEVWKRNGNTRFIGESVKVIDRNLTLYIFLFEL